MSSPVAAHPSPAAPFQAIFQSFISTADGSAGPARLAALRAVMAERGLAGYIIPRADAHQNEYVPAREERLAWLTGFTGSAGTCVILEDNAALFVDGRYVLQAPAQVDTAAFTVVPLVQMSPEAWLEENLPRGTSLGFDAWRTTLDGRERLSRAVAAVGGILVAVEQDLLDPIWPDRPAAPSAPVRQLDMAFAGADPAAKLAQVQEELAKDREGLDGLLISDPHNTAWLFNVRGADVNHTPLPLAWCLVPAQGRPSLFIDQGKLGGPVRSALAEVADIAPVAALEPTLATYAQGRTVRLDQATAPVHLGSVVERGGGRVSKGADPVTLLKASKNEAEIAGMRSAHVRDGVALARFLHWFAETAPKGGLTEIDAVEALETFRRETGELQDVSFPTISGAGPNGAIVHYRVTQDTNRAIATGELFLIDSGAQYPDGTTDVTRTLAVGTPTAEMRTRYTQVLKGHIAISRAVFPEGTSGSQLDPLARQFLWASGLDFEHGTGHGVGAGLSVHEGPARISKLGYVPLKAGMILSNEPGYYKAGAFGIRIENLVLVEPRKPEGAERPSLGFEVLTLAPYDRTLIDTALLSPEERTFIDFYHRRVLEEIGPRVPPATRAFLEQATAPL
ncbi:aminopeptidase P family protein [Aquabacter sp. L1I39]|uniref:aminopeptidase P family protein n=1 Tax=Aquabacter sp. L1I39 TaxID=2820278 RepID=UPI001ADCD542|nr:aminopeptidase P family protein [Aquabacter sp. L1I39]QTL02849.1 aminopeptidase P family protein [Aquabacter sp. L1I39]